jgi:hypothetical protein
MKKVIFSSLATLLIGLTVPAIPAYAHGDNTPKGNNGVVKISNEAVSDGIPQNHPHVNCNFKVEFYNYDKSNHYADVNFALQAPTNKSGNSLKVVSGNTHPFIGNYVSGDSHRLNARESYTLGFTGQAQKNQGYHVKVTVSAPGSQGNDKKYKVFWVEPCKQDTPTSTNPTETPKVLGETSDSTSKAPLASSATELPNTGIGTNAAIASILAGVLATAGHYVWRVRRSL